jgi:cadmium resistance protein CadD (predicted permease)
VNEIFLAMVEGVTAFVATNVDDLFILLLFFAQVNREFRPHHIVSGSYWGFAALTALSLIGFFGGLVVSSAWIGLLGILPLMLGVHQLLHQEQEQPDTLQHELDASPLFHQSSGIAFLTHLLHPQAYKVAVVTFANGGDNLGVYIPLFATSNGTELGIILSVFLLLRGVWCYVAYRFTQNSRMGYIFMRHGPAIVPFLFMGLGLLILWKNGTFKLLTGVGTDFLDSSYRTS